MPPTNMTVELTIELTSVGYYAEVKRQLTLPFLPPVGLCLQLEVLNEDPTETILLEPDCISDPDYLFLGIVRIDKMIFSVGEGILHAKSLHDFESNRHLLSAIDQLVLFYGFSKVCGYEYAV